MTHGKRRAARLLAAALLSLTLAGCISHPLPEHQPSMQSLEILRGADLPKLAVGKFALAPGLPARLDKSVTARSVNMVSPDNDSLASYLGKTLETDLQSAGKLDAGSDTVVDGLLTDSQVDAGIGTGSASLGAKFSLSRRGSVVFQKDIAAKATWDSSFFGAIAIPDAMNHYAALFKDLVAKLLADADFQKAARGTL